MAKDYRLTLAGFIKTFSENNFVNIVVYISSNKSSCKLTFLLSNIDQLKLIWTIQFSDIRLLT